MFADFLSLHVRYSQLHNRSSHYHKFILRILHSMCTQFILLSMLNTIEWCSTSSGHGAIRTLTSFYSFSDQAVDLVLLRSLHFICSAHFCISWYRWIERYGLQNEIRPCPLQNSITTTSLLNSWNHSKASEIYQICSHHYAQIKIAPDEGCLCRIFEFISVPRVCSRIWFAKMCLESMDQSVHETPLR
jgi:hypothetical protein